MTSSHLYQSSPAFFIFLTAIIQFGPVFHLVSSQMVVCYCKPRGGHHTELLVQC